MVSVGVRQLRDQVSQLLERVRNEGEVIEITYHGEAVARLVPVKRPAPDAAEAAAFWSDLDQLAAEIGANWPDDVTAVDAVAEGRRDL
jgi:prevent-host-death family protein